MNVRQNPIRLSFFCGIGLVLFYPILVAGSDNSQFSHYEEGKALLEEGKELEALNKAAKGLEYQPQSLELFDLASQAAQALGAPDIAIWYANLALLELGENPETEAHKELKTQLVTRVNELDPLSEKGVELLEKYAKSLFKLTNSIIKKKLYANAVDLLHHCEGTRFEGQAQERLDKLFSNKKSVEALLKSGINVPVKPAVRRSKKWLERENEKHKEWDNAHRFKTDDYLVNTNMDYELGKTISLAMEQMNHFFRKTFNYKFRGGGTQLCTINLYASREGFEKSVTEELSKSVRGYFAPWENSVTTYDPRSDGRSLGALWTTLFHEATHQFVHMVVPGLIPAWFNEGTACYFEGTRLRPTGMVESNLIARGRLFSLVAQLREDSPTLRDVVSYYQPGSYDGSYYSFGWGLVYFFQNYENEKSERIYLPLYQSYLKSYKTGEKHDPFDRFVDFFINKAGVPGVETFDDFDQFFQGWIQELFVLYMGPPEVADRLIERARKERDNKKPEYAVETYKWAVEKRPNHITAYFELAEVQTKLKEKDAAIFNYRKVLNLARSYVDPETPIPGSSEKTAGSLVDECIQRISKLDKSFTKALGKATAAFAESTMEMANEYVALNMPRRAMHFIDESEAILGGYGALQAFKEEIQEESGVSTQRWRRLEYWTDLKEWSLTSHWKGSNEGLAADGTDNFWGFAFYKSELPKRFRFKATFQVNDQIKNELGAGLILGNDSETGYHMFGFEKDEGSLIRGHILFAQFKETYEVVEEISTITPRALKKAFVLEAEVRPDQVELFLNDESLGTIDRNPDTIDRRIGLYIRDGLIEFTEIRVRY